MAITGNQLVELTVQGRALGQTILNVFHYRFVDPSAPQPAGEDMAQLASPFRDLWRNNVLPRLGDLYVVEVYRLRSLVSTVEDSPGPPPMRRVVQQDAYDLPGAGPDVGSKSGEHMPTFNAVGARKVSDRAGRRFRGGTRFSPIIETDQGNGFLVPLEITAWGVATFNLFTTDLEVAAGVFMEMCVFSRTSALALPPPQTNLRQFTAGVVGRVLNEHVTSQVSRKASIYTPV